MLRRELLFAIFNRQQEAAIQLSHSPVRHARTAAPSSQELQAAPSRRPSRPFQADVVPTAWAGMQSAFFGITHGCRGSTEPIHLSADAEHWLAPPRAWRKRAAARGVRNRCDATERTARSRLDCRLGCAAATDDVVAAIAQHRHFDRETDPPAGVSHRGALTTRRDDHG
jgi:hypothetical protein